jgi:SapC
MATQLLIYETVVPLAAATHRDGSVEAGANFSFSAKTNSVPLMAVEFPMAASEYAIVFAGTPENTMPAVILGLRGEENLFLSKGSTWEARYKPAFVRRYPFVFSPTADGQRFMLCIDEAFSGFNRDGRGQKLFGDDDQPTAYVDNILKFLQEYQRQFRRTQEFCNKLRELDLLEPMQARVEMKSGERLSLGGFMAVNRAKLKELPGDKLAELAKTDELELIYLHLQSMRNFTTLQERLAAGQAEAAAPSNGDDNPPAKPNGRGGASNGTAHAGA